ncbi:hypothetical protein JOD25_002051 [Kurthia huakuii]|nr:hypothetical protein [Kurthia huakuii]
MKFKQTRALDGRMMRATKTFTPLRTSEKRQPGFTRLYELPKTTP